MTQYAIGSTYSFNVYPVARLGNNFQNCVLQAILDASTVQQLGNDIYGWQKNLFPYLPAGTPSDPTQYQYLRFKLQSGISTILAVPWIDDSTVTLVESQTLQVTIGNVDAATWSPRVQLALAQLGLTNVTITVVNASGTGA